MPVADYQERIKTEKRNAAIDAALVAFLDRGYDRTSLVQIAKAAGISTGTLFKHFPTKAALFEAIMERSWESEPDRHRAEIPGGDPESGLFLIGMDYARVLRHPMTAPLFRLIIAEAVRFPELGKALFERGKAPYLDWVYAYIAGENARGTVAVEDIPLAAQQFLGMINNLVFWPGMFLGMDAMSDDLEPVVREAVRTFLARYQKDR